MLSAPPATPWLCALLLLAGTVVAPAFATTDEQRAAARSLAKEGATAFQEQDNERAIDLFGRAEALVHSPVHLLFSARAHVRLGRFVKAHEAYVKIARETLPADAPKAFRDAQRDGKRELEELEPRLSRLTIRVEGVEPGRAVVRLNGETVPGALLGVPMPVDPGEHELVATADGASEERAVVTLREGQQDAFTLRLSELDVTQQGAATTTTPDEASPPEATTTATGAWTYVGWTSIGLGAVGLGVAGYYLADAMAIDDEAGRRAFECGRFCSGEPLARIDAMDQEVADQKTRSAVFGVTGGVLLATGIVLVLVDAKAPDSPARAGLRPWLGPQTAGLDYTF